jgi:transglutaminase-like putative cysteine protease
MLRIYNTLTRAKQEFRPLHPPRVGLYVCGMTVYDYCHLGHARVMVVFDMVQRWLRASGYQLTYVRNITDIDDKIIERALQRGVHIDTVTEETIAAYHADMAAVGAAIAAPQGAAALEAARFAFESPHVTFDAAVQAYGADSLVPGRPLLEALLDLNRRIHRDFEFDSSATSVSTPLAEVLEHRHGVCQDFAHLMIGCLRAFGLSARYVSGYILTHPPEGQARLVGSDASHAWVSVYCPATSGSGDDWIDLDPTNDCLAGSGHVTLGWGRDFSDVTPTRGVILGGGEQELFVSVTVAPVDEASTAGGARPDAGYPAAG